MHIKNKFIRFIVSVIIALILFFLISFGLVRGDVSETLEAMFMFAVFGLFLVLPSLIFIVYLSYWLLTKKENRTKSKTAFKVLLTIIVIVGLLYIAAMKTDLFG